MGKDQPVDRIADPAGAAYAVMAMVLLAVIVTAANSIANRFGVKD